MRELSNKEEAPRARWPNYWLLGEHETSSMEVLAVDLDGGESPSGQPKGAFRSGQASPSVEEGCLNDTNLRVYDGL
jgi:hypothetical protein